MKLSNQAIGAVMAALQNCLANQTDIVPVFESWDFYMENGELFVENPPFLEPIHHDDFDVAVGDSEQAVFDFIESED